jgi:hypothetical protein
MNNTQVSEQLDMSNEEFEEIAERLSKYHSVFYKIWSMGKPFFTKSIPTAAVTFDKKGDFVRFLFNPDFWETRTTEQKDFIFCHEALHIILEHGRRCKNIYRYQRDSSNIAQDVVINHMLIKSFGFNQDNVDPAGAYCWIRTVYGKDSPRILEDECFEYYFNRLPRTKFLPVILVDVHNYKDSAVEVEGHIIPQLEEGLSATQKEEIEEAIKEALAPGDEPITGYVAGNLPGSAWKIMRAYVAPKKKKWETVIKNWEIKARNKNLRDVEQWSRTSRRWTLLPNDIILPSEMEDYEGRDESKINVYFFLDTSGSCEGYAERFWKAAQSLPKDKFIKKLFCFDTSVYPVNEKERKLYGFGGTNFGVLESYIQKEIKDGEKYPQAVFVITDGCGTEIRPAIAKRWYWFLTPFGVQHYIPKESKIFQLKDFE